MYASDRACDIKPQQINNYIMQRDQDMSWARVSEVHSFEAHAHVHSEGAGGGDDS